MRSAQNLMLEEFIERNLTYEVQVGNRNNDGFCKMGNEETA